MSMDFWAAQQRARTRTIIALIVFALMTFAIAAGAEILLRTFAEEAYGEGFPIVAFAFITVTFGVALFNYFMYQQQGGSYVAERVGARQIFPNSPHFKEQQLYNIVEEITVSASLPMPAVYILNAPAINAFAAGLVQDKAAITVTTAALEKLSRDEMQGVIAHECAHIHNGDMRISLQLAAMITGFFVLLYISYRVLYYTSYRSSSDSDSKKGNPIVLIGFALLLAGSVAWLGGQVLKCFVSRQRESLADASAVQFTRNPEGLIGALIKIEKEASHEMPKDGKPYEHLYFDDAGFSSIFATHPPIEERIAALRGLR